MKPYRTSAALIDRILFRTFFAIMFFLMVFPLSAHPAMEVCSRYTALHYDKGELLVAVNDKIAMKKTFSSWTRKKDLLTVEEELLAKLDSIVEHAESVLDMFPDKLKIPITFLENAAEVTLLFQETYSKEEHQTASYSPSFPRIAFYSLSNGTIYISVNDINNKVLVHEIAHAIVDRYFKTEVPHTIHELLAQFAEKHIND